MKKKPNNKNLLNFLSPFFIILFLGALFHNSNQPSYKKLESTKELKTMLWANHVEKITYDYRHGYIYITLNEKGLKSAKAKKDNIPTDPKNENAHYQLYVHPKFVDEYLALKKGNPSFPLLDTEESSIIDLFLNSTIFSTLLYLFGLFFLMSFVFSGTLGKNMVEITRSKAILWDKNNKTGITFKDVKGMEEAKNQVKDIVNYFKYPEKYKKIGAVSPKGAILIGAPGTGKTFLAKAIAGESDIAFLSTNGSDFTSMYMGGSTARIRNLFKKARKLKKAIIFIDEIDTIGRKRKTIGHHSHEDGDGALNQLLYELDGFESDAQIFVIGATNRVEMLDNALLRSGRLEMKVYTNYPAKTEREGTFDYYLKKIKTENNVSTQTLAVRTPGFSYADIKNVVNSAALIAINNKRKKVTINDFHQAIDENIAGIKRKVKILKPKEKNIVAYHEAGHAIVGHFLPRLSKIVKVTIIPRTSSALGFAQYEAQEKQLHSKNYLLDQICSLLGGRASEAIFLKEISTGAQNDLEKVTEIAHNLIIVYGMNKKIGHISYYHRKNPQQYDFTRICSEKRLQLINEEIDKIITQQYQRAVDIIKKHQDKIEKVVATLKDKEEINGDQFRKLVGPRPTLATEQKITKTNKKTPKASPKEKPPVKKQKTPKAKPPAKKQKAPKKVKSDNISS